MKKYYYLLVAMMMAVMTAGLTACGNDNDDEPEGDNVNDYIEFTIDGTSKTIELPKGLFNVNMDGYKDKDGKDMTFFNISGLGLGRIGTVMMPIALYTYRSDFNMKTGSYSFRHIKNIGDDMFFDHDWWIFFYEDEDVKKPFETAIWLTSSNNEYYSINGTMNVKSIKPSTFTFEGIKGNGYTIEASFSCTLANENDKNDTKNCTGKYKLTYLPEDD